MKHIASLHGVTRRFKDEVVLKNLSLEFKQGKFTCLLGNSGSGKTTILRLISGLEKPDSGEIYINGRLASAEGKIYIPPHERQIGFIFQDLALWSHLTVYENIAFGLKVQRWKDIDKIINKMADFLGLTEHLHKYPHQLSGGQQQMVAIARSLVLNPEILLMDEPLANLDVKLKARIRKKIKSLIDEFAISIIYVTHDHREALDLADEIAVLNEGKIEQMGTPDEIRSSDNRFVREFVEE